MGYSNNLENLTENYNLPDYFKGQASLQDISSTPSMFYGFMQKLIFKSTNT